MLRKVEVSFREKIDNLKWECYNVLCIEITIRYLCGGHGISGISRKVLPTFVSSD